MGQRFFLHSPESDTWDRKGLKLIWVRIFIFFMSLPFSQIRFILFYFSPCRRPLLHVWKSRLWSNMFSSISRGVWEGEGCGLRFSDVSRRFLGSACPIPCHLQSLLPIFVFIFSPSFPFYPPQSFNRIRRGVVVCVPRIAHQPRSLVMSLLPRQRVTRESHPVPQGGPAAVDSIAAGNDALYPPPPHIPWSSKFMRPFFKSFTFFFSFHSFLFFPSISSNVEAATRQQFPPHWLTSIARTVCKELDRCSASRENNLFDW